MMILDNNGSNWGFSNATLTVIDNTYITNEVSTANQTVPDFNSLIPVYSPIGMTNVLELYLPGQTEDFIKNHGAPNAIKYGFNPYGVCGILDRVGSNAGVYTINLRGKDATMANVILLMKYKVEDDVLDPTTGITRDVMHIKFETKSISPIVTEEWLEEQAAAEPPVDTGNLKVGDPILYYIDPDTHEEKLVTDLTNIPDDAYTKGIHKWTELQKAMLSMRDDVPDPVDGYKTLPWWGVLYRGASSFANNIYFNMVNQVAAYDGNTYYTINLFNGYEMITTDPIYSLDTNAGKKYGANYYIENLFNQAFGSMRFVTATPSDEINEIISNYLFTAKEIEDGATEPALQFANINIFDATDNENRPLFQIVIDDGSLNVKLMNAFQLDGGYDGRESQDELFTKFFKGEILEDIVDPLRYRLNYIPDLGYTMDTKLAINDLVKERNRMTVATFMLGSDSFSSAVLEHQSKWYETNPCIRQIAAVQGAMRYDEYTNRTLYFPAGYYDLLGLMDFFVANGNYYNPYAGAYARWTDFEEDAMTYPSFNTNDLQVYFTNRINVVMKDWMDGCYMSDQLMNTQRQSDQTELNNAFIISNMLYDLVHLIHRNHFKFNEPEHVRAFGEAVSNMVYERYSRYSMSMTAEVKRMGTVGRAKMTNKIIVTINFLDINRYTNVELVLTDE